MDADTPPGERDDLVRLLEGRRLAFSSEMWHVPALTIAGQAFLLQVLTKRDLALAVAIVVAAAGFLTNIAAALSFLQQYEREKWLGEEIGARLPLLPKPPKHSLYTPLGWKARWFWFAVLLAFAGADVVAVAVTQS